jgi:arylsulfatase A-like enzyme
MTILDQNIGLVLDALPPQVAENTIIVFTSYHGDYASAHGFVSGKVEQGMVSVGLPALGRSERAVPKSY